MRLAILAGLGTIAITDHDSMNGVDEALAAAAGTSLKVIPGVELSTDIPRGEVHLLGYYLDPHLPELDALLATLRGSRVQRAQRMVEKLDSLGMPVSWERVQAIANGASVGRPHVARALIEAGHVSSVQDAFSLYIGREGPAYVDRYKLTPVEATALVTRLGGLAVLAHPSFVPELDRVLPGLVEAGLAGMEVYYTGLLAGDDRAAARAGQAVRAGAGRRQRFPRGQRGAVGGAGQRARCPIAPWRRWSGGWRRGRSSRSRSAEAGMTAGDVSNSVGAGLRPAPTLYPRETVSRAPCQPQWPCLLSRGR